MLGKLFHQGVEAWHTAATYPGVCLQWLSSQQKKGSVVIVHDPSPNIQFRGIPCSIRKRGFSDHETRQLCLFTFPLMWKVASCEKQTRIRNVSSSRPLFPLLFVQIIFFPVPLMEVMLWFMEHKVKKVPSFHSL